MKSLTPLRRALTDPKLLGKALAGESWEGWRSLLLALALVVAGLWVAQDRGP